MCNGDRETAQLLGMLAALSENLSLALSTHVGQFTTACNFRSRGNPCFWPPRALIIMCIYPQTGN